MAKKYIRISKDDLESILMKAVSNEIKEAQSYGVSGNMLLTITVIGSSIAAEVMNSLPGEVYESDVVDFPNSN